MSSALKQQAVDRVKAKADAQQVKRPLIAPQLTKLTQLRFDVVFDPDSSLIRPGSYSMIGSLADALSDPKLRPVQVPDRRSHRVRRPARRQSDAEPAARRFDPGRAGVDLQDLQQASALALGLGEEQLQDSSKPASPVNARLQIIAFGQPDAVEPKPAAPAAAAKKGAASAKKKR